MTKPLSPAAQAVLDAAFPVYDEDEHLYVVSGEQHAGLIAAAALKAAADQAVPESCFESDDITAIRQQLLAIAVELEGYQ